MNILLLLLGAPILILALVFAYWTLSSYRFKKYFAKTASQLGYRVHEHPYCFLGSRMYTEFKNQQNLHNDAHYHYKNQLSKYDVIVSNLVFRTMVEVQSPELIRQFFTKANQGYYVKSQVGFGHLQRLINKENLLLSEGQYWKNRRRILSAVFNFDFIVQKIPKIQQITKQVFDRLQKKQNSSTITCNIAQPLASVFSTVILKCFFKGDRINSVGNERTIDYIDKMLRKISDVGRSKMGVVLGVKFARMGLTSINKQINQEITFFRKVIKDVVLKRIKQIKQEQKTMKKDNGHPQDIIQALMKSKQINLDDAGVENQKSVKTDDDEEKQKLNNADKQIITIDSIINQFVTFFLAGSQTTLSFTRMMIYRLASNPKILDKVRQQFKRQVKTDQVTFEQLKNLKYFQKVQKQVLRLDSSVGAVFTRIATKDHYLGNLKIYKGMAVNVRIRGTHYKEQQYPSPRQFNPDRWDQKYARNNFSYIPFSGGARICIGQHLALLQNKIFMIELLRRYKQIKIPKNVEDITMRISTLYGPEEIMTTLTKA